MPTRKTQPTLASLNAQIEALQAQAEAIRKKEVSDVVAKVKDAIAHYGLTAADLGLAKQRATSAVPAGKTKRRAVGKKSATNGAPKRVKFRDEQGNTWGGIGKRPEWFKAALASGKSPEELLAQN